MQPWWFWCKTMPAEGILTRIVILRPRGSGGTIIFNLFRTKILLLRQILSYICPVQSRLACFPYADAHGENYGQHADIEQIRFRITWSDPFCRHSSGNSGGDWNRFRVQVNSSGLLKNVCSQISTANPCLAVSGCAEMYFLYCCQKIWCSLQCLFCVNDFALLPTLTITVSSTVIHHIITPRSYKVLSSIHMWLMNTADPFRIRRGEQETSRWNHLSLSAPIQESGCDSSARSWTKTEQRMDQYQRHELRCEASGDASHAGIRSCDILHYVQSVCVMIAPK